MANTENFHKKNMLSFSTCACLITPTKTDFKAMW